MGLIGEGNRKVCGGCCGGVGWRKVRCRVVGLRFRWRGSEGVDWGWVGKVKENFENIFPPFGRVVK